MQEQKNLNLFLASTIRRLRTEKGISQEELAQRANVDRTYISGIERARRNITIGTLERLIPHLCGSPMAFFENLCQELSTTAPLEAAAARENRAVIN